MNTYYLFSGNGYSSGNWKRIETSHIDIHLNMVRRASDATWAHAYDSPYKLTDGSWAGLDVETRVPHNIPNRLIINENN